jgi:two-component system, LuxR family, response regulator FixJ
MIMTQNLVGRAEGTGMSFIYVADDDAADRQRLHDILIPAGYCVRQFGGGNSLLAALPMLGAGCVLLDVRMPEPDGLTVVERIAAERPDLPVIMISGHSTLPVAVEAMKRGAKDFVEKPASAEVLLRAIERAFRLRPQETLPKPRLTREQLLAKISRREGQVLELLVQGYPNKVVAHELGIAENTVEVHRYRLMKRLNITRFAELVRLAVEAGI